MGSPHDDPGIVILVNILHPQVFSEGSSRNTWPPPAAPPVDAENQTLGRLSSKVSQILRGKGKVNYTPHMDMGDFVIIINAEKINVSGNKTTKKEYFKHTNYPGGAKTISYNTLYDVWSAYYFCGWKYWFW